MNSGNAKTTLKLYRPNYDEKGPEVIAALAQLEMDTELKHWYQQHRKNEQIISQEIRSVKVPATLLEQLKADNQAKHAQTQTTSPKRFAPLAVAAAILLVFFTMLSALQTPRGDFLSFRSDMLSTVSTEYKLDIVATDLIELRKGLEQINWPSDYIEPKTLKLLHTVGGLALSWQDNKVSTLCMETDDGKYVWLFIIDNDALQNNSLPARFNMVSIDHLMTSSWTNADKTYLIAVEGGEELLKQYL